MNAEIIAVGSELLLGQIQNANAQFLSQELSFLGIDVYYHSVVGDNPDRLKETIHIAQQRADIIIFTGGLGPTKDDLTKVTIAEATGQELVMNEEALASIQQFYDQRQMTMTANNRKQAVVIKGATVFTNRTGMAPGMAFSAADRLYMLFPGPPRELEPMFKEQAKAYLQHHIGTEDYILSRVLRFFGIGESTLETDIMDLIESQSNPTIAPLAGRSEVTLRLTAKHTSQEQASQLIDSLETLILQRVGYYFYGYDETSLPLEVLHQLQTSQQTIAAAESLTGGMFSNMITGKPGASQVFKGGVICYANDVKQHMLQVPENVLTEEGAVSQRTARLLAEHVRSQLSADIGLSFTGVAGPDAVEGKQAGLVYIGLATRTSTNVYQLQLAGGRHRIRQQTAMYGYFHLLKFLKK